MEKSVKPENLYIRRNRVLTAFAALICLVFAAAMSIAYAFAAIKFPPEDKTLFIAISICVALFSFIFLCLFILNLSNLFFPYLITCDEKGIYDYSGYIHLGLIEWREIKEILSNSDAGALRGFSLALVRVLSFADGEPPKICLYLKEPKQFKSKLPFFKRAALIFRNYTTIPTRCGQCKNTELNALLKERLSYYGLPEELSEINYGQ